MFAFVPASVVTGNIRFKADAKKANRYESLCNKRGETLAKILKHTKNARIKKKVQAKLRHMLNNAEAAMHTVQGLVKTGFTKADFIQLNRNALRIMTPITGRKDALVTQYEFTLYNEALVKNMLAEVARNGEDELRMLADARQEFGL